MNNSADTSNFQKALHVWEEINLPNLQKQLDDDVVDIRTKQKSLLESRRELASKTKQFKKLEDIEKLELINVIFKQYQKEIDSLNKNNKFIESVFFKLYKDISEAPDPRPLLSSSMKAMENLNDTEALQSEILSLRERLSRTLDYDLIKSKLIDSEQKHAERLRSKLKSKDEEYSSKIQDLNMTISKKDTSLHFLKKQVEELKAVNEVSSKKKKKVNGDDIHGGDSNNNNDLAVELDLVTRDLQLSKSKIYELEKQNEELAQILDSKSLSNDKIEKLNKRIVSLEKINSELIQKSNSESQTIKEYPILLEKFSKITSENTNHLQKIKLLESKLSIDSNVDETINDVNDQTLIAKSNQLTNELVGLRNKNDELSKKNNVLVLNIKKLSSEISQLKSANERIEADLLHLKSNANEANDNWDSASMISGISRLPSNIPARSVSGNKFANHGRVSPAASIAGFDDSSSIFGSPINNSSNQNDGSLLLIITQQRDRFRAKNSELEGKLRENSKLLSELKKANSDLTKKIAKLTTEIKYLQQSGKKISAVAAVSTPYSDQLESGTYDTLFKDDYESFSYINENPLLNLLSKYLGINHDAVKKIDKKLNVFEKFFYNFFKIVLSNENSRIIFIVYLCVMHLILFLSLLRFFFNESPSEDISIKISQ